MRRATKMESSDMNVGTMQIGDSRKRCLDPDNEHYRTKRTHNSNAETVLLKQLIPSQLSGAVLGKGGATVTAMISETNTSIKMSKAGDFYPGSNDRILIITGLAEKVKMAHNLVWEKLRERNEVIEELKMKLVVPHPTVGMIIGKGGSYIKTVKEQTGAFVQVSQKAPDTCLPERVVTIGGSVQSTSSAFDLIFEMIREDPQSGSCPSISYADYRGPVANPNLTTSPYAYSNPPASLNMPMGGQKFDMRSNDTVEALKATLRNAGNSVQATEEITAAMCTLAQYGLMGFGSGHGMYGFGMGGVGASGGSVGGLTLQYLTGILSGETTANIPMGGGGNMGGGGGGGGASSSGFNKRSNNVGGNRGFEMNVASNNNGNSFNFGGRGNSGDASGWSGGDHSFGGLAGNHSFSSAASAFGGGQQGGGGGGESEELQVSEAFVGAVLGHGGKAIVEIQRMTGATIQVSKKGVYAEGTRNRIVTVTGARGAVNQAVQYVKDCIVQEEEKRARQDRMKL